MAPTLSLTSLSAPSSEPDLVAAARAGDDQAFSELYARYQDRIRGFILARVHDHGRAEDIAQEVFISALRRLRSSEQTIAFKPWIYEIAKNACIDEFRRHTRTREVSLDSDEELVSGRRGLLSVAPTPPAAVDRKLQLDDLQGAFSGLSESHHKLLMMREFEGRSYSEIATSTGMSLPMVESALFRARRKLTEEYNELASGRRCEQVQVAIETGRLRSLRSMGIRERRQLTRHLAHCQLCRREARLAGVDESLVKPRSIAARIAALLPLPLWRWPWRGGSRGAVQSLQSVAGAAGPTGTSVTLGQAAVAVATLAIAGAGGGAVTGLWNTDHAFRPAAVMRPVVAHPASPAVATARGAVAAPSTAPARHMATTVSPGSPAVTTTQSSRSAHQRAALTQAPHSTAPGPKTASPAKTAGTPGGTAPTSTNGATKTAGATIATRPITAPVTKTAGTVSGLPTKVGSTLKGVTRTTVPTVVKSVSGTVKSLLPTKVPSLSQTLGGVLPPSGAGPASSVTTSAGALASGVSSAVAPTVAGTTKAVTGTVDKTVTGTVGKTVAGTVGKTVSGILSP